MRLRQLLSIGLLTAFGLGAIAQVASAVPVAAYDSTDLKQPIYVTGLTPYESYDVHQTGLSKSYVKKANDCGFFKVSNTTSKPNTLGDVIVADLVFYEINDTASNGRTAIPVQAAPKCTNGVLAGNTSPAAVLRDSENNIYVTGLTPFSSIEYANQSQYVISKKKANACGILKASASDVPSVQNPVNIYPKGSTTLTLAITALTGVAAPPGCKNGVTLLPSTWPTP